MLVRFIPLAGVLALSFALLARSVEAGQVLPSPSPGASQAYDVTLRLTAPVAAAGSNSACTNLQQQSAAQAHLLFVLSGPASAQRLTVWPIDLSEASLPQSGETALTTDQGDLLFDDLVLGIGSQTVELRHGRIHLSGTDSAFAPVQLELRDADLGIRTVSGDVISSCDVIATGSGVVDRTGPTVFFAGLCHDRTSCGTLPDGAIIIGLSKPVQLKSAAALLSATDNSGAAVKLFLPDITQSSGYTLSVRGAWTLGSEVTLQISPGVADIAGNMSKQATQDSFVVVDDPGDLDAADNSGFETGDLTGYVALSAPNTREFGTFAPYDTDSVGYLVPGATTLGNVGPTPSGSPEVVEAFQGVQPSEGQWMLKSGSLMTCSGGTTVLVARFDIPTGVRSLVVDLNALSGGKNSTGELLSLSMRTPSGIVSGQRRWNDLSNLNSLNDEAMATGWQQLAVDVSRIGGQSAVLTLRARPQSLLGPPPLCVPGVLLLDNFRFS